MGPQHCQTRTDAVGVGIGVSSPQVPGVPTVRFGIDYTLSLSDTNCYEASDTTACHWNDQGCHTVFTSQQILKQLGYRRQRCDWGDGDHTECMADTRIDTPTQRTAEQCGAECGKEELVIVTSTSSSTSSTSTQSSSSVPSTTGPAAAASSSVIPSASEESRSCKVSVVFRAVVFVLSFV